METRCKPGDIAVIIYDEPDCLANVGRLVRVHPTLQLNLDLNLFCWLIEPLDADPWYVSEADGRITVEVVNASSQAEHPDLWMLPIKDEQVGIYAMTVEEFQTYERIQACIDECLAEGVQP